MFNTSSSPTLTGCTFTGNSAGDDGGGMYNSSSSPTLTGCTFSGNSASGSGGGMFNYSSSSPTLTGCTFSGNSASGSGGGMLNNGSSPTLTNCTFEGNSAAYGGGMYNDLSSPSLTNVTFTGNTAGDGGLGDGGGMSNASNSQPHLANVTFSGNTATRWGGGMSNGNSSPTLTNVTFTENTAGDSGGGIYNYNSSPALANCILWGDSPDEISGEMGSVTYSDVEEGYTGIGNINADPLFVNAASGDLHLGPGSPCIDAGTNATPDLPPLDFEGDPRILDGNDDRIPTVDMGVDEVWGPPPPVIFVDLDAVGTNSGTSWDNAFTSLQPALTWAAEGVEIWVAEGIYKPTDGTDRTMSFQMKNGVAIYGGFAGTETELGQRDWVLHETILSGNIGDEGTGTDNSYHVFYHPLGTNLDSSAVLDGFTITGGSADGAAPHYAGGGMLNNGSSPTLTNCTFEGNSATYGGGMHNENSSPTLTNVTFTGNTAGDGGLGDGGGMNNASDSEPVLANVTFSGNTATRWGGGMSNGDSSPTLTNVTFSENTAGDSGGGIYNYNSSPALVNCILWGDSSPEIQNVSSMPAVGHSDIQGGYTGTGNIDADPLFLDPVNGDLHLRLGSPCIDAGLNPALNLPDTDFEGDPRILDGNGDGTATVDMGVDEALWLPVYLPLVLRNY
jgi:parallel beta-helix repeat protein/predicted outer membrane repeat protein